MLGQQEVAPVRMGGHMLGQKEVSTCQDGSAHVRSAGSFYLSGWDSTCLVSGNCYALCYLTIGKINAIDHDHYHNSYTYSNYKYLLYNL